MIDDDYDFLELSDTDIREIFITHFQNKQIVINKLVNILLLYSHRKNNSINIVSKYGINFNGINNGITTLLYSNQKYNSVVDKKSVYRIISVLIENNFIRTAKKFNESIEWVLSREDTISLLYKAIQANQYTTTKWLCSKFKYLYSNEKLNIFQKIKENVEHINIHILDLLPILEDLTKLNILLSLAKRKKNKKLVEYLLVLRNKMFQKSFTVCDRTTSSHSY